MAALDLINDLASRGRYHFTTAKAAARLGSSVVAARAALRRLQHKGVIAMPYRGFYVIVPPEYSRLGCLPADQFVPQLMEHLGLDWAQRLGYILEQVGVADMTEPLARHVDSLVNESTTLVPSSPANGAPYDARWRLFANVALEPDL